MHPIIRKLLAFLSKPWLSALFFTLLIVPFTTFNPGKDTFSIQHTYTFGHKQVLFEDLNNDGESEFVRISNHLGYQVYVEIRTLHDKMYDQWNGKYVLIPNAPVFCGDYDQDSFKEIYLFTYQDDTVYLNVTEFFDDNGLEAKGIPVDYVPLSNDTIGYQISFSGIFDGNGDGQKEIYFTIHNGFALFPRKIYKYEPKTSTISASHNFGVMYKSEAECADVTGDGSPELFGKISAVNNFSDTAAIRYPDHSAWLLVFEAGLTPLFPAIEYPDPLSMVTAIPFYTKKDTFILAFYDYAGVFQKTAPRIDIYSAQGKYIKQIDLSGFGTTLFKVWKGDPDYKKIYFHLANPMGIYEITPDLSIKQQIKLENDTYFIQFMMDSRSYYFAYSPNNYQYSLYDDKFNELGNVPLTLEGHIARIGEVHMKAQENSMFFIQTSNGKAHVIVYNQKKINPEALIKIGILYSVVFFLILFGRWIYRTQAYQRQQTLSQLTRFQMLSIKNQLDPHFTFNAVNTLGGLIYSGEKQKAYNYLLRFSNLLRNQLTSSDKLLIPLENEIQATKDYLELQKMRFGHKLVYEMNVDEGIQLNIMVPRLCIHTYVENAIKHGIKPKEVGGKVTINLFTENKKLIIEITDNGIGRTKSKHYNLSSTGKGMPSMEKLYAYINHTYKETIAYEVIDLADNNQQPTGTKVRIIIPTTLKEEK